MICLWISIVIGFVNDFVIERFGKERAGLWARSGLRDSFFFYFGKIALVPGRELPGQIDKAHLSRMLNPGWKTGINARWQPGLKGSSVLVTAYLSPPGAVLKGPTRSTPHHSKRQTGVMGCRGIGGECDCLPCHWHPRHLRTRSSASRTAVGQ